MMIAALLIFAALCSPAPPDGSELVGQKAPDFSLFDYKREVQTLYQYEGQPVLLVFWFPGDENSEQALTALESVYQDYREKGLVVIAVDIKAQTSDALMFLSRNHLSYVTLEGYLEWAMRDYLVEGAPTAYLIGRDLRITNYFAGYDEGFARRIKTALDLLLRDSGSAPPEFPDP